MSTYSISVSGPSPRLAMLRALALKAAHAGTEMLSALKVTLTRGGQLVRTASSTTLAIIGSDVGYQFARSLARTVVTTVAAVVRQPVDLLVAGLRIAGRLCRAAIGSISPLLAASIDAHLHRWIVTPANRWTSTATRWVQKAAEAVWELSDHSLVKTVTVRAAQAASLLLAVHTITQGAVAARVVQSFPWLMDAVITVTNPTRVVLFVAAVFVSALCITAARLMRWSPSPDPVGLRVDLVHPQVDPGTPTLQTGPRTTVPTWDFDRIAAQVNVEVTPDGSVLVHGIPAELPDDVGRHVAQIAADAAAERLRRVLLHRPVPNRDDRRLLTKTAREALRAEGRRAARSAA